MTSKAFWKVVQGFRFIKHKGCIRSLTNPAHCPITAVAVLRGIYQVTDADCWEFAADGLGLSREFAKLIIDASDGLNEPVNHTKARPFRTRLLKMVRET